MINYLLSDYPIAITFLAGMCGGIIADILNDNSIELPKKIGGKLLLGWIGGAVLGGFAGALIDGSLVTAFMGGFMGKEIITKLTYNSGSMTKYNEEKSLEKEPEKSLESINATI